MKRAYFPALLFSFLWVVPGPLIAEEGKADISIKAELDRGEITIGDPVHYSISIRRDPSVEILSSIPYPPSNLFEIKNIEEFQDEDGGQVIEGKTFTLTAFKVGEYILDPVKVEYRVPGEEVESLETSRIFLTVKSVMEGEPVEDIRHVKGTVPMSRGNWLWASLALIAVSLLAALLIYRWRRKKPSGEERPEEIISPEEEALRNLSELFYSELLKQGKISEYYFRLSEILRLYLEKRYGILAVESTTDEISRMLKARDLPNELRTKIREVLESADLAKFAKWVPEPAEVRVLNERSREIVELCRPKQAEQEAAGGI